MVKMLSCVMYTLPQVEKEREAKGDLTQTAHFRTGAEIRGTRPQAGGHWSHQRWEGSPGASRGRQPSRTDRGLLGSELAGPFLLLDHPACGPH